MDLYELKKNDIMMRQDLSTYQCALEETFDLSEKAYTMKKTIDLRVDRIQGTEIKHADNLLTDLVAMAGRLNELKSEKR